MPERVFTPEEANALVPQLRPLLAQLREAHHELGFARSQWQELESFGQGEGEEALAWREKTEALAARVVALLDEVRAMGAVVKDPLQGLADFPARRRDGSLVLLCYRDDEERIGHWHPLEGGFAARRPLVDL
ncbi:MAG TPA: DUF2203 domain-containing protein [Candidatus Thermoplasmatota archaeon]|nr:DUF2203 domain-containing protein [Candidatus Thermoplasmatota archaeon]